MRERMEEAWRTGETDVFVDSAGWLLRHEALGGFSARRLADKLIELGRHADAVAIHQRYPKAEKSQYWRSLAAALAGTEQLAQAREALARAEQLDGAASQPDGGFAEALRRACAQGSESEQVAPWPQAASLVEAYVVLGLPDRASEALRGALDSPSLLSEEQTLEALRLAQDVLRLADPRSAADLMESILARFGERSANEAAVRPGVQLCQALALARAGRNEQAVSLLAPLSRHFKDSEVTGAEDARLELARTVGRLVLDEVKPRLGPGGQRKIIDMFPMNDELLMLRIKLEEMSDWVDHFVIVESVFTFRGQPKPLHFEQHKAEFSRFSDKIVHVVVDALPPWASTPWAREFYQRDCGLRALARLCGPDDLVLVTDVDEIVRRAAVEAFNGPFAGLAMPCYSYFFNLERIEARQSLWATALRARYLQRIGASYAKIGLPQYAKQISMDDAGWHFSGVRDVDGLLSKFRSYSNDQWSQVPRSQLVEVVSQIHTDGGLPGFVRREIDDSFPAYIREHTEDLGGLIF